MQGLVAVYLALLALCGAADAAVDRAQLIRLAGSIWKVEAQRSEGGYSMGSGVAVAPDEILTNCHVTRTSRHISVVRGGRRWPAEAQAVDAEHDLCVLRVPGLGAAPVTIGSSQALRPGQTVMALGYTGGLELQYSDGQVVALHRLDGARVVQSSNAFTSGASGGGLFDEDMRLVGILTFRLRGGAAHYFSAPVEWLQPLQRDGARYAEVHVLDAAELPYWQRTAVDQPAFLRAAVMERERRWDELEGLAFNWTRVEADDPQPWYLHGLALDALHRWPESQRALERSLQLEPQSPLALYRLGLVHAEQGQLDRARQVRGRLEGMQPDLAAELGRAIDTTSR